MAGWVEQVSACRQSTAISTRGTANYCHVYKDQVVHPGIPVTDTERCRIFRKKEKVESHRGWRSLSEPSGRRAVSLMIPSCHCSSAVPRIRVDSTKMPA